MVRIDKIWTGHLLPLVVTQAAVTTEVGLIETDWRAPMELVCARLEAVLDAAYPLQSWDVDRLSGGDIVIRCTAAFNLTFRGGFNAFLGFSLTTYTGAVLITSDLDPTYFDDDVRLEFSLPALTWHRAVPDERHPVVWDGPFFVWNFKKYESRWVGASNVDLFRHPFVAIPNEANLTPWDLDNRDGYVTCRPLAEGAQRTPLGARSADWASATFRCRWLDPQIAV